ncbi:MAG TPA: DUF805 domain-containing protein [Planktothrix sp.]
MNEYISVVEKYWCFDGRATRREYWMFVLFNFIFTVAAFLVSVALALITHVNALDLLWQLYVLAVFAPNLGVTARRLHDTNRSGWFQLLCLIPVVGPIVLLVYQCEQGTPGDNNYGPSLIGTNNII